MNQTFISSFNYKNNDEFLSAIKQFLKYSIKLEPILYSISDDYFYLNPIEDEKDLQIINLVDKKILIVKFYMNTIIKMLMFDLRYIILQDLNKNISKE